jgi:hypothetical protein
MDIWLDDLTGPEIRGLIDEHLRNMALHTPSESIHALPLDALRKPGVTFWSVWQNSELMGCGALKELRRFLRRRARCTHATGFSLADRSRTTSKIPIASA